MKKLVIKILSFFILCSDFVLLITIIFVWPFFWMLRDGLGPNAAETSSGFIAIKRSLNVFNSGYLLLFLFFLGLIGKFFLRKKTKDLILYTIFYCVIFCVMLILFYILGFAQRL